MIICLFGSTAISKDARIWARSQTIESILLGMKKYYNLSIFRIFLKYKKSGLKSGFCQLYQHFVAKLDSSSEESILNKVRQKEWCSALLSLSQHTFTIFFFFFVTLIFYVF